MRWSLLLLLTACETSAPMIEGKVVDIWKNPIEGATVMVVGGTERPLTDADGRYQLARIPGVLQVKAGRKGYIQDHKEFEIKPEDEHPAGPLFELFPKPEEAGFFVVGSGKYLKLAPSTVYSVGNALTQFRGIKTYGDVSTDNTIPQVVFHTDLRHDEIMRLGLELHRVELLGTAEIPGPVGTTRVTVNLHVEKGDHPIEIEPLRSKTDYLITPKEPLPPGIYALQTQELLSPDQAQFASIPEELRVVFPFVVN